MADTIEKSEKDLRVYKPFVLDNKILCLAISDPSTEHSAASMNVRVGSVSEEVNGLAHFLEHMLFMGTEKYPEENKYQNFINDHAGFSNAYTASENTNYYFKVSSNHFHEALDIFSQFFICPLFNSDSVDRELKAVDSEYNKNILDDYWRTEQILRNSLSAPFNHFGSGNSSTLKIEGIREKMIEFYNRYYSANLMSLVLYGKEDVEELQRWAKEMFETVPNRNVELPEREKPIFGNLKTLTRVVPVKDTKSLRLLWTLPPQAKNYKYKPDKFISNLLGHEGKNSLLSYLKSENLADTVNSGLYDDFECYSYIYIDIKLTDKGLEQYETILEICYAYINNIQSIDVQEYLFEELKAVAFSEFTFKNKEDPFWFTQRLCTRYHRYPPSKVLSGIELYEVFNPELIKETLSYLSVDNLQVCLMSQTLDKSQMITEKWYGTFYSTSVIPDELIERLKNPSVDISRKQLTIPPPNPYVAKSHNILPSTKEKCPTEVLKSNKSRVFHKANTKFSTDKVYGQLILFCNSLRFDVSVFLYVLGDIWCKIINEKLREDIYQAELAGLNHTIEIDNHGVRVCLNGFSEKYPDFFEHIVKSLAILKPDLNDKNLFEDIKSQLGLKLKNIFYDKPYSQVQRVVYETNLAGGYFVVADRIKALNQIEFEDILWFSEKWLKNVYFEWIVIGNITAERTLEMTKACVEAFEAARAPNFMQPHEFLLVKSLKIAKSKDITFKTSLTDTNDTNSAVVSQWQIGPETAELQALVSLVDTYIEEPCFNILRTKEQLGYIVWSYTHKIRGILNIIVLIQSSVKCPTFLIGRISEFIKHMRDELENVDEARFEKIKEASIKSTFKKDLSLNDEFNRLKFEVDSAAYIFDRRKIVKGFIRKMQIHEFKEFFQHIFFGKERRLNMQVLSDKMKEEEVKESKTGKAEVTELSEFWRKSSTWPQVYIRNI